MTKQKAYVNEKQLAFLSSVAPFRCWIGGRGSGKGGGLGYSILDKQRIMPGSAGLTTCLTLEQFKANSYSTVRKIWKRHRMRENVHYCNFIKPPSAWIERSIAPPGEFKNTIYFPNGSWLKVVSARQYDAARGGSYDYAEVDEAGFFDERFYTEVLAASIRGNVGRWNTPRHQQVSFYSSMPHKPEGKWLLKFEELMQADPLEFYYQESTAYDNIEIFGAENLERIRRVIPYLTFQVEFMNMRITQTENQFYHKFDVELHQYGDDDPSAANPIYNPRRGLSLTFDFGGFYSCLGVLQEYKGDEYGLRDFDATKSESIRDLCIKFDEAYPDHKEKHVKIYGDPRGHDPSPFGNSPYQEVAKVLSARGWIVEICVLKTPADGHQWRFIQLNNILAEDNPQLPRLRLHRYWCKDSVIAMQITEVKDDFKKNKAPERDRKFPQAHAPHNTDKLDYFFMQKYGYKLGLARRYLPNFTHT